MATGTITSLGMGSSLDLQSMLDTQREADEAINNLKLANIEKHTGVEDALNSVLNQLLSMKTSALSLSLSSNYLYRSVTVADESQITASAIDGADIGTTRVITNRLASYSTYVSNGFSSQTDSVYVPTRLASTKTFAGTDTVLANGETLSVSFGDEGEPRTFSITANGDMTAQALVDAINTSADNMGNGSNPLVTASLVTEGDGTVSVALEAASGGSGEENRVAVSGDTTIGFSAPVKEISFKLGEGGEAYTISVPADSALKDIVDRINEDKSNPGVKASIIDTGIGDTPYQLVLTADDSGEDSRIIMLSSPDDLSFNEAGGRGYIMTGDEAISFDTALTVDDTNNTITFSENGGGTVTAEIENGDYETAEALAEAVEIALEAASTKDGEGADYTVTIDSDTGKMSISEAGTLDSVAINWGDAACTAGRSLGFTETREITPADSSLNASVTVDGNSYQRQENEGLDDIIGGVILNLYSTGTTTLKVEAKTDTVKECITSLIETYNTLIKEIDENDDYDKDEESWGPLARSSTVKTLKTSLAGLLTSAVDSGGEMTCLLDLGVELKKDGTLTLNEKSLADVLSNHYEEVQGLLLGTDTATGLGDLLNDALGAYALGDGYIQTEIDGIEGKLKRLEESYGTQVERIEKKYEIMAAEYTALDSYLAELGSIQSYIETIMASDDDD